MFGGKKLEAERARAEQAERTLALLQSQLASVVEGSKMLQQTNRLLQQRLQDAESAPRENGDARAAREELLVLRERDKNAAAQIRALDEKLEARARAAEEVPVLKAELAGLRNDLRAAEGALAEAEKASREVQGALAALAHASASLRRYGVDATLAPRAASDLREAAASLQRSADAYVAALRLLEAEPLGAARTVASDVDAFRAQARNLCASANFEAERTALLEQARLWIGDPKLEGYHVELLTPYVASVEEFLRRSSTMAALEGASLALRLVREAQRSAAGHLMRRSRALDGLTLKPALAIERYGHDPQHAIDRLHALIGQVRGLGPVDFFHNVATAAARSVKAREPGASYAAWLLADATNAILDDKRVRAWIADTAT